ncbi:MAG: sugar ABC transporter substrate-binding protein [Actinomycetota bacterium]|nr:sugar ABC transporter substrate-binding protein [Actinomycetota bacterium]
MRRRRFLLVLMLAATACTGTGDAGTVQSGTGEISVLVWGEPEELQGYRDIVTEFEAGHPRLDVKLIETADRDDLLTRLSTSLAGGTPPDLFLLSYRFVGQYAARGALEPIQSRLESSAAFERDDFYEKALEAFTFDGVLTCLPQNISSLVVYYNRDMFEEIGLTEPKAGWTWNDMVGAAQQLTRDEDGDGRPEQYGLGVESSIIRVAPFIWSNGGTLVDDTTQPTGFDITSPAAVEVLDAFFALRERHGVIPTEREIEAQDDETRFLNGTTAMILASRRETPSFRTITDFDWDVAPLPVFRTPAGILHSDAYCMTTASANKDAAWRFMEFALGPEGQRITAEAGRTVPSLIEVAESEAFLDPSAKPANSRVFLDTIPTIQRVPNISTWPEIEERADEILEVGMYHLVPALDIAVRIQRETREMFLRAEA